MMKEISVRAFRAPDDLESCKRFLEGHTDVLRAFGIKKVTSATAEWMFNPNSYVITAECMETGEMLAGIRVHTIHEDHPLPMEEAIAKKDARVFDYVAQKAKNGTGEICGLWNSRSAKGLGISFLLMKMSCSILNQTGVDCLLGLCSPYTLPMLQSVGYVIDPTLGNNGTFYYPKDDLIATTIILRDIQKFRYADKDVARHILKMRKTPAGRTIEKTKDATLVVYYNLNIATPVHAEEEELLTFA